MKKIFGVITLALFTQLAANAQSTKEKKEEERKPSRDFVMIQLSTDHWDNSSDDKINTKGLGRGFNAYLCYDFAIGQKENSHVSFAIGIGVSSSNIYFDKQLPNLRNTNDYVNFVDRPSNEKGHKFSTTFLEAPLELRFFGNNLNRNKGFKFAIGAKVGMLMDAHLKYKEPVSGVFMNVKESNRSFNQTWRLSPTARVGWGNFSIFAQYSVTQVFKTNIGPKINPFSIGLTISGL